MQAPPAVKAQAAGSQPEIFPGLGFGAIQGWRRCLIFARMEMESGFEGGGLRGFCGNWVNLIAFYHRCL